MEAAFFWGSVVGAAIATLAETIFFSYKYEALVRELETQVSDLTFQVGFYQEARLRRALEDDAQEKKEE